MIVGLKYQLLWFAWLIRTWYLRAYYSLFPRRKVKTENERIHDYVASEKERFLGKYDRIKNTAIEDVFYSKRKFHTKMKENNNEVERAWRTRILMQNTVRGNVAMYFDPYKLGFAYYSDGMIPYDILNILSMKYVERFQCRDFFMDETIIPEGKSTPLMILINDEKKEPEESKPTKETKKAPMAKLKNYSKIAISESEGKNTEKTPGQLVVEKNTNRFVYLGKFNNFKILQIPPTNIPCVNLFAKDKSVLMDGLFDNTQAQKEVFSYRDFKSINHRNT
jgi:hypothetical protein